MNLIDEIKADVNGARILTEWLGDGGIPVPHENAERRSITCLCCAENKQGNWWDKVKSRVARAIREHLEVKNRLQLHVEHEDEMGTCQVCRCNLALKVHVQIAHILNHTSEETMSRFPDFCWVKKRA